MFSSTGRSWMDMAVSLWNFGKFSFKIQTSGVYKEFSFDFRTCMKNNPKKTSKMVLFVIHCSPYICNEGRIAPNTISINSGSFSFWPYYALIPIYQISMPSLTPSSHWVWVYSYWILNVKRAPEMASIFIILGLIDKVSSGKISKSI